MNVAEFMTTPVVSCSEDSTVEQAAKMMLDGGFSILPVVNTQNELLGVVTESDFIGHDAKIPHALGSIKSLFGELSQLRNVEDIYKRAKNRKVGEIMSKTAKTKTVSPTTTLSEVVSIMSSKNLKRLPVLEDGKLVGIITRKDLIRAFAKVV